VDFELAISGKRELSAQVYRGLRSAILGCRLQPGEQLPSTRELASQLGVARKTVLRAYERLASESLIEGKIGSGTRVPATLVLTQQGRPRYGSVLRPRPEWVRIAQRHVKPERPVRFDFSVGVPDASLFPFALWRSLIASSGRVLGMAEGMYAAAQGDIRLREAIARYVAFTRGVVCDSSQIVVTRGAQQAIDLLVRVLLKHGDTVVVEEPGYPPVRELLTVNEMNVVPTAVDLQGLRVAELPTSARMVYVTPSHQFPLGAPMSLDRKLSLLRWAAEHQACIVEDDYDSEYRFDPRPLESLQSLDRSGVVTYVGTFSKILHPGLRVGFIVSPPTLISALTQARRLSDSHESLVLQHALARFISEGHLARHVRKMSKVYGQRRAVVLDLLERHRNLFGEVVPSVAGLHLTCLQSSSKQSQTLLAKAAKANVGLTPLRVFSTRPGYTATVLGYGAISEQRIRQAFAALAH
jgi:GntR family transcriptional regulator/MocR family aminotransferase